ncbi:hypothetical protein C0J52_02891 [Blattella germanica]|nr:hypothetical protein C0J52_02891 [Blattella germanica]
MLSLLAKTKIGAWATAVAQQPLKINNTEALPLTSTTHTETVDGGLQRRYWKSHPYLPTQMSLVIKTKWLGYSCSLRCLTEG